MKITTVKSNFSKTLIVLNGKEVTFNHTGVCEVEDNLGKELLSKYPRTFFNIDAKPNEIKVDVSTQQKDQLIKNLEAEIDMLKGSVKAEKSKTEVAEANFREWAKLAEGKEKEADNLREELMNVTKAFEDRIKFLELKVRLQESNVEGIKNLCEKSGFPVEEWGKMNKEKLINYLLKKSE